MDDKEVSLKLNIEEVNKIMTALGNLPYVQVYELINKIQQQVSGQVNQNQENITTNTSDNGTKKGK
ncbi:MAG: hypothetical protein V5A47_11495 [Bacteroidales bacterium]|nr:hypothetical protein [Bacteroidales bacterium]MBS3776632.1 hypothetical protein [Bacteroidales bacterium]